jgi:hypothetical protein
MAPTKKFDMRRYFPCESFSQNRARAAAFSAPWYKAENSTFGEPMIGDSSPEVGIFYYRANTESRGFNGLSGECSVCFVNGVDPSSSFISSNIPGVATSGAYLTSSVTLGGTGTGACLTSSGAGGVAAFGL